MLWILMQAIFDLTSPRAFCMVQSLRSLSMRRQTLVHMIVLIETRPDGLERYVEEGVSVLVSL
jgi:hypothetical protein